MEIFENGFQCFDVNHVKDLAASLKISLAWGLKLLSLKNILLVIFLSRRQNTINYQVTLFTCGNIN